MLTKYKKKEIREKYKTNPIKYSTGITTFLKGIVSTGLIDIKKELQDEIKEKMGEDGEITFDSDEMNLGKLEIYDLGLKIHDLIEKDLITRFNCYSPLFKKDLKENDNNQIQKMTDWMKEKLGYIFLTTELPVWLSLSPVKQIRFTEDKGKSKASYKNNTKELISYFVWLVGKLDLLATDTKGKLTLIDFKTALYGKVTLKDLMQLRLLALCLASMGVWVDKLVIITINTSLKKEKLTAKRFFIKMNKKKFKDFILSPIPEKEYWKEFEEKSEYLDARITNE